MKKLYIETYGCQMNLSDSEIVSSIMIESGWEMTSELDNADAILLNTCSVRDNAEQRIIKRLKMLESKHKKRKNKLIIGVIGCMAERFQEHLIEMNSIISIVIGPDEYRKMPQMLEQAASGSKAIAVELSKVETYDDIVPLRTEGVSAWLSIMRGCNNFCSYCVVPYTRGRERSRDMGSIIDEVKGLVSKGFKEITLLGQNVNSYSDPTSGEKIHILLERTALIDPKLRVRFTTSNPRDMSDELIEMVAKYDNICKHIHLPIQSGSNAVLKRMNRRYTVEHYLSIVEKIRNKIPEISLSTDIISGYPGETLDDHNETLDMLRKVRYSGAYMFKYSPREGTKAFSEQDDVPEEEKSRRLAEIISVQSDISKELNQSEKGKIYELLVENVSKRKKEEWVGRTSSNKATIFPNPDGKYKSGDLVKVKITRYTSATLYGELVEMQ